MCGTGSVSLLGAFWGTAVTSFGYNPGGRRSRCPGCGRRAEAEGGGGDSRKRAGPAPALASAMRSLCLLGLGREGAEGSGPVPRPCSAPYGVS